MCVSGEAGPAELEHMSQCPECRDEVARFRGGIALFRKAVQDMAESPAAAPATAGIPAWSWTLAAAALVAAVVLPFFIAPPRPIVNAPADMAPEVVMERLNSHLAGMVPEPMEPMLSLIEGDRSQ